MNFIENVQRFFTRRLPGLSSLSYFKDYLLLTYHHLKLDVKDMIVFYFIIFFMVIYAQLIIILRINRTLLTLLFILKVMISSNKKYLLTLQIMCDKYITHVNCNVNKYLSFLRTALIWN